MPVHREHLKVHFVRAVIRENNRCGNLPSDMVMLLEPEQSRVETAGEWSNLRESWREGEREREMEMGTREWELKEEENDDFSSLSLRDPAKTNQCKEK